MLNDILTPMKYAVISHGGAQHQVEENQKLSVFHVEGEVGAVGTISDVLLFVDDKKVEIGSPLIKNASVEYKIDKQYRSRKMEVFKYKSKSRYRKTKGHRDIMTDIIITKLNF